MKKFDEFNTKFKFIFFLDSDRKVANVLNIPYGTFGYMKKRDAIPYEQVIQYCEEKCIDLNWLLNLKK